ncbi:MFS transporter [Pseudonocardia adelaidensis]|uniref:Major facilitator superfamily (MFS) profile domain-containing protein n=1 Tax=Pseudonocardia adelaidensis TaxID=648754 RepID=A0ABP9NFH2_9PSEU
MTRSAPVDEHTPSTSPRATVVLVLLAGLVALGPLSTDAHVPGLPMLAADLGAPATLAQLTVTTCLIGLAVGQLVAGPLSDALGKRRPVLAGLAVYTRRRLRARRAPAR